MRHPSATAAVLLAAVVTAGCGASRVIRPGPSYPAGTPRTAPSNIQLVRETRTVRMTNTTALSYGPSRIWLNQWYSTDIQGLRVGESVELRLSRFEDEFGDSFRGGGFFAAEAPDKIVKAELQTERDGERVLIPLIVVGDQD